MKGSFTTRKGALYCIVMTCLCSLLATGCASKYGAQTTDVHYYPDCYQPIADLRSAEKSFNTTMVMGTTMGALLGAVIGASQTGKAEGALAGAAIGAGAGAGASYLVAKYNNERDDRVRLASYARDLNADVNSLNRVTAAGQVAYNCYSAKFRAALEDYKAKRITRAELDRRYAEIKSGLAEASAILGSTLSEADKREAEYRQVLTIEAKKASRTARTGNGIACRRPGNRCGGSSRCSRCRSSHTGGRFPVFRLAPEYRGRGFVRALREQAPVDEHGMAVDDEDIVRRRDEQRLAEQDAAGRVVEMGGDGFPRPAQGSPRLFGLSRVEAGDRKLMIRESIEALW